LALKLIPMVNVLWNGVNKYVYYLDYGAQYAATHGLLVLSAKRGAP